MTYKMSNQFFEEGQIIFKNGDNIDKVYILADGNIDAYVSVNDEDLVLDNISVPGCVIGQHTFLMADAKVTYSARTTQETNMLVLSREAVEKLRDKLHDLNDQIEIAQKHIQSSSYPLLDY